MTTLTAKQRQHELLSAVGATGLSGLNSEGAQSFYTSKGIPASAFIVATDFKTLHQEGAVVLKGESYFLPQACSNGTKFQQQAVKKVAPPINKAFLKQVNASTLKQACEVSLTDTTTMFINFHEVMGRTVFEFPDGVVIEDEVEAKSYYDSLVARAKMDEQRRNGRG